MKKKQNKLLVAAIIVLAVIVICLTVYIVIDKNKGIHKSAGTTESFVKENKNDNSCTDAESTDTDAKTASVTDSEKRDINSEKSCYVSVSDGGGWQNGDSYVKQYNVDIHNDSSEELNDWDVVLTDFTSANVGDGWNAKFKISGSEIHCTAVDYNGTLAPESTTSFGLQVKFASEDKVPSKVESKLLINGKEYLNVKNTATTESGVDASKADKSDTGKSDTDKSEIKKSDSQKEKAKSSQGTPVAIHGKLSVKGTDIVDKNGDKFQLKGVSTHGLAWFPQYVNEDAFKTFRDEWGANVVRLAMYTAENGGYCTGGDKAQLKSLVESGVDSASKLGMYVIIDWHILSDGNPLTYKDDAISFFDEMSSKYADYDNVIFEICNEPNGSTEWSDIKEYAESVIPVIRKNDKDAIIIVGTPTWSQDVDVAAKDPITGQSNIMYTCHFYAATHKDNIRNKVKQAHEAGLPIFVSEFSICDASGNGGIDYDSAKSWMDLLDEYNISYVGWSVSNKSETSALLKSGCEKKSDWTDDDLTDTGKWLKSTISE